MVGVGDSHADAKHGNQAVEGVLHPFGVFFTIGVGLIILTIASGGDFWWSPVVLLWLLAIIGHASADYWTWKRRQREVAFDPKHLSPEPRAELEWNQRAGVFGGGDGGR